MHASGAIVTKIVPFGAFNVSNTKQVQIVKFGAFYVTGYASSGQGFNNPCIGAGDEFDDRSGFSPQFTVDLTVDADGGKPREVRFQCRLGACDASAPTWTPDGKYLLFSSDRTGVANIFLYDVNDRNQYQLGTNAFPFAWMNGERTPLEWRQYGQDVMVEGPKGEVASRLPVEITARIDDGHVLRCAPGEHHAGDAGERCGYRPPQRPRRACPRVVIPWTSRRGTRDASNQAR